MKRFNYDAWLHWRVTNRCNLNCHYCFEFDSEAKKHGELFTIDIPVLINTLHKTNKTFKISFVGGEPFLVPNIVEVCSKITQRHYIAFNTNLTSANIKEFTDKIDPDRVIYILASLHIKELEKRHLLNKYIDHFLLCKEKGFVIDAVEIAHPSLLSQAEQYKYFFRRHKINIVFTHYIGDYNGKKYPESYTTEELSIFDLKQENIERHNQAGKDCNAGYNVAVVCQNGDVFPCHHIREKLGNVYEDIIFKDKLMTCPIQFCECPLKSYDENLFEKAKKENTRALSLVYRKLRAPLTRSKNAQRE